MGTSDYREMLELVTALGEETGQPPADLVRTFGQHLFGRFSEGHPEFFEDIPDAFELLRHLRTRTDLPEVPVVVLTAKELTTEECQELRGRALEVLQKGHGGQRPLTARVQALLRTASARFV